MAWYENFLGTFCEMVVVFLFLRLFSDAYKREKGRTFLCICTVACVDTFFYVSGDGYWMESVANIFLVALSIKWISHQSWPRCIFQFTAAFMFVNLSEMLLIGISHTVETGETISTVTRFAHLVILILLSYYLGTRTSLQNRWRMFYDRWQQILHFILGNLFVISFLEVYLWNNKNQLFYQEIGLVFIVLVLWIVVNGFLLKSLLDNRKKKEQLLIHTNYIDMIEGLLEDLHEEKHEFRKHLQTLEGLSHEEDHGKAIHGVQAYLGELQVAEDQREEKKTKGYLTGNRVIDALLYMKGKDAEVQNLTFLYIPTNPFPGLPCQEYELIELVGNLLNNAFEYVQPLPLDIRKVTLRIEKRKDGAYIEIRNPFVENEMVPFNKMSQKGYSTKAEGKRGYGLHHVKVLAEKYHGSLSLLREDDSFVAAVYFNNSSGQSGSP